MTESMPPEKSETPDEEAKDLTTRPDDAATDSPTIYSIDPGKFLAKPKRRHNSRILHTGNRGGSMGSGDFLAKPVRRSSREVSHGTKGGSLDAGEFKQPEDIRRERSGQLPPPDVDPNDDQQTDE